MPRTLSANVSTGIAGDYRPCYLLQVVGSSNTYYWATEAFTDGLTTYSGARIARGGLGKIKNSIEIGAGGNIAQVNKFKFKLGNTDNYSDTLALEYFENRRVEVRLVFPQIGGASWANGLQLFKGYTESIDWDEEFIYFDCSDGWMRWKKELPATVLTEDDWPLIHEDNIGKPAPIIYGDFKIQGEHKTGIRLDGNSYGTRDYVRGLIVRCDQMEDTGAGFVGATVVFAEHDLKEFTSGISERFFDWLSAFKAWAYFACTNEGDETFSDGLYKRTGCTLRPSGSNTHVIWIVPLLTAQAGISNGANCVDKTYDTETTLFDGDSVDYAVPSKIGGMNETSAANVTFLIEARYVGGTYADDKLKYTIDGGGLASPMTGYITDLTRTAHIFAQFATANEDSIEDITIKLEYEKVNTDDAGSFHIDNLCIGIPVRNGEAFKEVYAVVQGRKFGAWVDEAAHSNSFDEGDLIENPVYAIESLLIDSAGAAIGDIHAANFDAMATLRSSWKTAREIMEREDVYEFIRQICHEFGFACFERYDGTFTARRIDATADIVTTYTTDSYALDQSAKSTFKVKRGKIGDIRNEFYLRYKINYATGEPEKVLFVKSPEQGSWDASYSNLASGAEDAWNKCHAVYTNFQQKNVWDYTAKWIRDDATAELLLEFVVNLLTRRPLGVSHETGLKMLGMEMLDECKHTHDLLPAADNSTTRFRLTAMEHDPETDRLFMEYTAVA